MKSLHCYLLVAALALSAMFAPNAFANATRPVRGIDVIVKKDPGSSARQQHTTVDADGGISVKLSEPGKYTITYADGPSKGKVLWQGEVKKAQSVSCKVDKAYVPAPAEGTISKSRSNVKNNK